MRVLALVLLLTAAPEARAQLTALEGAFGAAAREARASAETARREAEAARTRMRGSSAFDAIRDAADERLASGGEGYRPEAELPAPGRRRPGETIPIVVIGVHPQPFGGRGDSADYGARALRALTLQALAADRMYGACGLSVEIKMAFTIRPVPAVGASGLSFSCDARYCEPDKPHERRPFLRIADDVSHLGIPVFVPVRISGRSAGLAYGAPRGLPLAGKPLEMLFVERQAAEEEGGEALLSHELGHLLLSIEHESNPAHFLHTPLLSVQRQTRLTARECARARIQARLRGRR